MSHTSSEMAADSHVLGVIETDVFCGKCGFNLHTQKVWRDDRLGIPICRCPECGAIDAAGRNTASSSLWLKRLAFVGMILWLAIVLGFIAGTGLLMWGTQMSGPEGLLIERTVSKATGEVVFQSANSTPPTYTTRRPSAANPTLSLSEVVERPQLVSWLTGAPEIQPDYQYIYSRETRMSEAILIGIFLAVPHVLASVIIGCLVWFWRRRWRWVWILMPGVIACITISYWHTMIQYRTRSGYDRDGFEMYIYVVGTIAAMQTLGIIGGLLFGRPIGRFLISVLVPPKSRQLFAFLWHCDGKTMPVSKSSSERSLP